MIHIDLPPLDQDQVITSDSAKANAELLRLMSLVDQSLPFDGKIQNVQDVWRNKRGSNDSIAAFTYIRSLLKSHSKLGIYCHYCELSEGLDIEHIRPKRAFPEATFDWSNYLNVCKNCNMGYKGDKCFVIDMAGNVTEIGRGVEPDINQRHCFIHQRTEDPFAFFDYTPKDGIYIMKNDNYIKWQIAYNTLGILKLNDRVDLIKSRENRYDYIDSLFESLIRSQRSNSVGDLMSAIPKKYHHWLDNEVALDLRKSLWKDAVKKLVTSPPHPVVWEAIKRYSSERDPIWQNRFLQLPEALNW